MNKENLLCEARLGGAAASGRKRMIGKRGVNSVNEYMLAFGGEVFAACPKSVFAAVAASLLSMGGDYLDEARDGLIEEWWALYENAIVSQKPPFQKPDPNRPRRRVRE